MARARRSHIFFLIVLFFLTFFLRIYGLDHTPLSVDEKQGIMQRHYVITNGLKNFLFVPPEWEWPANPSYNYTKNAVHMNYGMHSPTTPLSWQLMSVSMLLFGDSPFGLRFLSALFGTLFVIIFYFFLRKIMDFYTSTLATFLLAFYPFAITNARSGAILEPFTLFFFIVSLYFLLHYPTRKGRIAWMFFSALMIFSNFPKAILILGVLFLWELIVLFKQKNLTLTTFFSLVFFYALPFVPSLLWFSFRSLLFHLPFFWFIEHPFARGAIVPFRIIEIFYSYGSIKQAALLFIPALFGFILATFTFKKEGIILDNPYRRIFFLFYLMFPIILVLMLLAKQSGPHNHSLLVFSFVLLTINVLQAIHSAIKKGRYILFLFFFVFTWIYILTVQNMGALITSVPQQDAAALAIYQQTFFMIITSPFFLIPFLILTLVSFFFIILPFFLLPKHYYTLCMTLLLFSLLFYLVHAFSLVYFQFI